MKDEQKSAFFKELLGYASFEAQLALEEDTYNAYLKDLIGLKLTSETVGLEYAKLRGALEALTILKQNRERLAEAARSRLQNS